MDDFFKSDELNLGTKGLVYIGDKVLIYRRDDKTPKFPLQLDVPGGKNELSETPFETFAREVHEEFGLDVSNDQIVYARRYPSVYEEGFYAWFTVAKLPESAADKIQFGQEGLEFRLMNVHEYLSAKDAWRLYQDRANDYLATIRG